MATNTQNGSERRMKMNELNNQIFKEIGRFYQSFQLTYSERALIEEVIENITEGRLPTDGLQPLTVTEQLVIRKVMDYLNRRIKVELWLILHLVK